MNIVVKVILGLAGIAGTVLIVMLVMTISVAFAVIVGLGLGLMLLSAFTASLLGKARPQGGAQAGARGNLGNRAGPGGRSNSGGGSAGTGRTRTRANNAAMGGRGRPNLNSAPEIHAKTIKKDKPSD